jgi:hypothetical protein
MLLADSMYMLAAGFLAFGGLKRRKTDLRWHGVPVRFETLGSGNPLYGEFHRIYRRMLCRVLFGHSPLLIGNTNICRRCFTLLNGEDASGLFDPQMVDTAGMTMTPTAPHRTPAEHAHHDAA